MILRFICLAVQWIENKSVPFFPVEETVTKIVERNRQTGVIK